MNIGDATGSSVFRKTLTLAILFVLVSSALTLLSFSRDASAQAETWAGDWSGTYQFSQTTDGVSITGSGQWSYTIDDSGQLSGQFSFQATADILPAEGCQGTSLTLTGQETLTGAVQGSTADVQATVSGEFPAYTLNCTFSGNSSAVSFPSQPFSYTEDFPIDLATLETGSYNYASGSESVSFQLSSGPSQSSSASTTTPLTTSSEATTTTAPTTSSAPTISSSSSESLSASSSSSSTGACGAGYHLGGIPNSQGASVCVPDGLQVEEGGIATNTPVGGDGALLQTDGNSVVQLPCLIQGGECSPSPDSALIGPNTLGEYGQSSCSGAVECATAAATYLQQLYGACQQNAACAQAWELATSAKDYYDSASEFFTTANQFGYGTAGANYVVALVNGWAFQQAKDALKAATVFVSQQAGVAATDSSTPSDPALSIHALANGTTVYDYQGSVLVQSLATNRSVVLAGGQEVFIPSDLTQASGQNLTDSVRAFNPNAVSQWWSVSPVTESQPAPELSLFGIPYGFLLLPLLIVFVCVAVGVTLDRRNSRKSAGPYVGPAPRPQASAAAQTVPRFCTHCGHQVSAAAVFCEDCGKKLSPYRSG